MERDAGSLAFMTVRQAEGEKALHSKEYVATAVTADFVLLYAKEAGSYVPLGVDYNSALVLRACF